MISASDAGEPRRLVSVGRLFATRGVGAAAQFGANALLSNLLGAGGVGRYFLYVSWSNVLCTLGSLGLPELTLRTVATGQPPHGAASRRFVSSALGLALWSSAAIVVLLLLGSRPVAAWLLRDAASGFVVAFAAVTALLFVRTRIQTAALKACNWREAAIALETSALPVLVIAGVGAAVLAGLQLSAEPAVRIHVMAALVVMLAAHLLWSRVARDAGAPGTPSPPARPAARNLLPLWGSSLLGVMSTNLPFFVLPHVAAAADIGRFAIATRLVALATIILQAMSSYFAPHFARAHACGDVTALARQLRASQLYSSVAYLPFLVAFALFPGPILRLFGAEFGAARGLLWILAAGQAVNAITGLVGYFLIMIGREREVFVVQLGIFGASALAMIAAGSAYSVAGVAWVQALGLAVLNLAQLVQAWLHLRRAEPSR